MDDLVTTRTDIKFYINNLRKETQSTNLPTALMKFNIKQTYNTTASRNVHVDFVKITSDHNSNSTESCINKIKININNTIFVINFIYTY